MNMLLDWLMVLYEEVRYGDISVVNIQLCK